MGFLEDILLGSIAKGVNSATLFVINFSLLGCVALLLHLLLLGGIQPDVKLHLGVLIFFALGLLASVNWVVRQTGTVKPEDQRRELFGDKDQETTAKEGKKTE